MSHKTHARHVDRKVIYYCFKHSVSPIYDGRLDLNLRLPVARLGLRTGILGKVGPGGNSQLIIQRLQDSGKDELQAKTADLEVTQG